MLLDRAQPGGLSWLGFAIVYSLSLVLVAVLMWLARRPHGWGALPVPLPGLDLEQLAYLLGGPTRAAEAVLAKLLADKTLSARKPPGITSPEAAWSTPTVWARSPYPGAAADVYRVAVTAAAVLIRHEELLERVAHSPEMTSVLDGLRDRRLIVIGSRNKVWAQMRRWGPTAPMSALLLLAVTRLGDAGSDPAAWAHLPASEKIAVVVMTTLAIIGNMWILGFWWVRTVGVYAYLTPAGLALVHALRHSQSHPTEERTAVVAAHYSEVLDSPAGIVALHGLACYPDPTVRSALDRPAPPSSSRDGHGGT